MKSGLESCGNLRVSSPTTFPPENEEDQMTTQTYEQTEAFPKPPKTQVELAEEFLEHFQADVESAEKSLINAKVKLSAAVVLRDDAEANLVRARRDQEFEITSEATDVTNNESIVQVTGPARQLGAAPEDAEFEEVEADPPALSVVIVLYPGDPEAHVTKVGEYTRYSELVADYLAAAGLDEPIEGFGVYSEDGGWERNLTDVVGHLDYGKRLMVAKHDGAGENAADGQEADEAQEPAA